MNLKSFIFRNNKKVVDDETSGTWEIFNFVDMQLKC